jgi:Fis family transcriptional regulator
MNLPVRRERRKQPIRRSVGEVEPALLDVVMNHVEGNQTQAAELLGINRGTLRKKLKLYGL